MADTDPPGGGTTESRQAFWEGVHDGKDVDGVSWWQSVPELSLGLVDSAGLDLDAPIIDVGVGWSTLVDHLLARRYRHLTPLDLSSTALQTVPHRLRPHG